MGWPTAQDYQEAIQNPRLNLGNSELQTGRVEEDQLGLPRPYSGGFATAYKFFCPSRTWAVRCFLKEFSDQQQRYAAISNQLAISKFPFATHFQFFQQGIRIQGNWHPIVKMEWVQGDTLSRYVETNLYSPQKLLSLGLDIVEIGRALNRAGVSHGDLQHGNILVANGKPKLIDYDGMYVPALRGWQTHEAGHPNYQLPLRDESDFGPGLDNFSVWVIYLSLRALSIRPTLWSQFQGGDNCLILRRPDFEDPSRSSVLQELKRFPEPEIKQLTIAFESLLSLSPLKVPIIDPGSPKAAASGRPATDWLHDHLPHAAGQPTATAFSLTSKLAQINQFPRPSGIYTIWQSPGVSPTPWPLPVNPPVAPAVPSILVSPPAFPAFAPPTAKYHPAVVPVDSLQYAIAVAAMIFVALTPLSAVTGVVAGALGAGRNALVAGAGFCIGAVVFTTWWVVLEMKRRREEQELNHDFEEEQRQHKALQREHVERCKRRLKELQEQARKKYDELMAKWNAEILPFKHEAARRREAVQSAKANLQRTEQQWKLASDAAINLFDRKKAEVIRIMDDHDCVENQREAELKQMLVKARETQFNAHLSQHLVQVAAIENIGDKLKKKLIDNGLRTALDVGRFQWPKGFGDARKAVVVQWRRNVEATFIFKTAKAIVPHEMQTFESKYQHLRELIQRQLNAVEQELRKISQDAATQLNNLTQQIKTYMIQSDKAKADVAVIPRGL